MLQSVRAYRWDTSRFASRLQGWAGPAATSRKSRLYAVAVGLILADQAAGPEFAPGFAEAVRGYCEANEELAEAGRNSRDQSRRGERDKKAGVLLFGGDWQPPPPQPVWRVVVDLGWVELRGRVQPGLFSDFDNDTRLSLLRCVFGNPFRPVAFDPAWRSSDAVGVATRMYETRDFSPMPILADALQDAGCAADEVLNHCRGAGPHVRGCWVVDQVLGKS